MNIYWILSFFTKFLSINFSSWRFTRNNEELVKAKIDVFAGIVTAVCGSLRTKYVQLLISPPMWYLRVSIIQRLRKTQLMFDVMYALSITYYYWLYKFIPHPWQNILTSYTYKPKNLSFVYSIVIFEAEKGTTTFVKTLLQNSL